MGHYPIYCSKEARSCLEGYRLIVVMRWASILHRQKEDQEKRSHYTPWVWPSKVSFQQQQGERHVMGKQQGLVIVEEPPRWRSQPELCNWKRQEGLDQKQQLKTAGFNYWFLQEGGRGWLWLWFDGLVTACHFSNNMECAPSSRSHQAPAYPAPCIRRLGQT